jgi:endonuclease/exonuclease/phosphatase family metal-dependent hydrolase
VRVVTFNIRHGAPEDDYRGRPDALAAACAGLDADILALQEVDVDLPRSQHADLAKVVADATGMTHVFAKARRHNYRGQYGNALLVRGTIGDVEVVRLRGDHRHNVTIGNLVLTPFREPRNAIIATVGVDGRQVSVGTGHFATEPAVRQRQLDTAAQRLSRRAQPRILLGDFNIGWAQAGRWLEPYGLRLAESGGIGAQQGIDHVALDGLSAVRVETRWLPISDHAAKIVDVTWD